MPNEMKEAFHPATWRIPGSNVLLMEATLADVRAGVEFLEREQKKLDCQINFLKSAYVAVAEAA